MHIRNRLLVCFAVLLLLATFSWPISAQGGIRVVASSSESRFADTITFRLTAESDAPIVEAVIYRQLVGEHVKVLARPEIKPGKRVEIEYVWKLEAGDIAPGVTLSYFWELQDQAGKQLRTEPTVFNYDDDRFEWKMLSVEQLVVHYYGGKRDQAQSILDTAIEAAQRLQREIGITVEQPIQVYVYNSRTDMQPALSPRGGVYDTRTVTLGVAMGRNTLLLLGSDINVRATVAHELSHVILGLATDNPYTDLPRWLDEGLAMYAEGKLPTDNANALEKAIREDRLISVRSLSSYVGKPEQVDLFYGEVYSLVDFMLKTYGKEKLNTLLETLKSGATVEKVLQQVYGFGQDQLDDAWRASLGLRARAESTPAFSVMPARSGTPGRGRLTCPNPLAFAWLALSGVFLLLRHH
jgi:hypothetical protein